MAAVNLPPEFQFHFRSTDGEVVKAWTHSFGGEAYSRHISATLGDTFLDAPPADALVLPTNSFGFLECPFEQKCVARFGGHIQSRLQDAIRGHFSGELLIGQCAVIDTSPLAADRTHPEIDSAQSIRFLLAVPVVRAPKDTSNPISVFQAFRSVILVARKHNLNLGIGSVPIRTILCPHLGAEMPRMSVGTCVHQLKQAVDGYLLKCVPSLTDPQDLWEPSSHEEKLVLGEK